MRVIQSMHYLNAQCHIGLYRWRKNRGHIIYEDHPNTGNIAASRFVDCRTQQVHAYTISGTSDHHSSTLMAPFDWQGMTSYYDCIVTLGPDAVEL